MLKNKQNDENIEKAESILSLFIDYHIFLNSHLNLKMLSDISGFSKQEVEYLCSEIIEMPLDDLISYHRMRFLKNIPLSSPYRNKNIWKMGGFKSRRAYKRCLKNIAF